MRNPEFSLNIHTTVFFRDAPDGNMKCSLPNPMPMRRQKGYVLLVLLLFVALLSISLLAVVQRLDTQIRRDREEEMIHRGVQYSRAIRKYVKKFGRYPGTLEELESTNNIRFLRKRYKDPITGKDFKILHIYDVKSMSPSAAPNAAANPAQPLGPNVENARFLSVNQAETGANTPNPPPSNGVNANPDDPPTAEQQLAASVEQSAQEEAQAPPATTPQITMGAPIVGVTSSSKERTIRVFNKKEHYNEWQFVYDPTADTLAAMNGPTQPPLRRVQQLQQEQQKGDSGTSSVNQPNPPAPSGAQAPVQQ